MICSLIVGLIFGLVLLTGVMLIAGISSGKSDLNVYTDSKQKVYDGVPLTDHNWNMEGTLRTAIRRKPCIRALERTWAKAKTSLSFSLRTIWAET